MALRCDGEHAHKYVGKGLADDDALAWDLLGRYLGLPAPPYARCLEGRPPAEVCPDDRSRRAALTDYLRVFSDAGPAETPRDAADVPGLYELPAELDPPERAPGDYLRASRGARHDDPAGTGAARAVTTDGARESDSVEGAAKRGAKTRGPTGAREGMPVGRPRGQTGLWYGARAHAMFGNASGSTRNGFGWNWLWLEDGCQTGVPAVTH